MPIASDEHRQKAQSVLISTYGIVRCEAMESGEYALIENAIATALANVEAAANIQIQHFYQLWLELKDRFAHKFVVGTWPDGAVDKFCEKCGVSQSEDHAGYDCIAWLQRKQKELEAAAEARGLERAAEVALTHDRIHSSGYRCYEGEVIAEKIRALQPDSSYSARLVEAERLLREVAEAINQSDARTLEALRSQILAAIDDNKER